MGEYAVEIAKEVAAPGYASLLYSTQEVLLLRWLEFHSAAAPVTALGVGNPLDDAGGILTSFDAPLKDGHVFAKVLLSHCPFLMTIDAAAPPVSATGDVEYGTAIDNLYPRPCSPANAAANLGIVLSTLHAIGLRFSAGVGTAELTPNELYESSG